MYFPPRTMGQASYKVYEQFDKDMTNWLYGDWTKEKLTQYEFLSNLPFIGAYMDYKLDIRADEEYLSRYQMDYKDIHDPRKLKQVRSGSALYGSAYNWVGKNIGRLYR